ncbi:MAG: hypothetical protein B6D58_02260, partial [candidate division Zixibacteria bacterium 4484_95]
MINMRIDVIRKELDRRFREVEKFSAGTFDELERVINPFLHFLVTEPFIRPFVVELSRFSENFISSDKFKQVKDEIVSVIGCITSEIDKAGFFDETFQSNLPQEHYGNPFDLSDPDVEGEH